MRANVHVDLTDGSATDFHQDQLDLLSNGRSVAVDATHVYWIKGSSLSGASELWKRARCGGAPVKIRDGLYEVSAIEVVGNRVYIATSFGLYSVAK